MIEAEGRKPRLGSSFGESAKLCAICLHCLRSRVTDLFVVQTLTFQRLYVIFFIGHGSRRLVHLPVRATPAPGGR